MKNVDKNADYASNLLNKINHLSVGEEPIYQYFTDRNSVSWWTMQQQALRSEIREFATSKNFETFCKAQVSPKWYALLVDVVLYAIAIAITLLALAKLLLFRTQVLTYSADKLKKGTRMDPRMTALYDTLKKERVPYVEVIHTNLGKEFLQNALKRRRFVMYLESVDRLLIPFAWVRAKRAHRAMQDKVSLNNVFPEEEERVARYLLRKYTYRCCISAYRARVWSTIFKATGLKLFFTIDDLRHSNELVVAAQMVGIEVHMFQHSNFDYFYGLDMLPAKLYPFPDVYYAWNNYWLKRIVELSPLFAYFQDRIQKGGRVNGYTAGAFIERAGKDAVQPIEVLVPYEVNVDKKELFSYIERILACKNIRIIFKGRPDMSLEGQAAQYFLKPYVESGQVELRTAMNDKALAQVGIVVGVYTTLLDEMIEKGIPVGVFETSYPLYNNLADSDLAGRIDVEGEDICKQLDRVRRTSREVLLKRRGIFLDGTGNMVDTVQEVLRSIR